MTQSLILASGSKARRTMLANAGFQFHAHAPNIDEDSVQELAIAKDWSAKKLALTLAIHKARVISKYYPHALVLGSDQVLNNDGRLMAKADNMVEAFDNLKTLQGNPHRLISAAAIVCGDEVKSVFVEEARLIMRPLSNDQIQAYLDEVGSDLLGSVGCYQIEGFGIQLFERVDGDHFTILGMPLNRVMLELRKLGYDPLATDEF